MTLSPGLRAGTWDLYDLRDDGGYYALRYLPDDLPEPAPVVVFFHGSGSAPEGWQPILAPAADAAGVAVIAPKSETFLTFLPGTDDVTVEKSLERLGREIDIDPARLGLSGHSAGGGHAAVMAYGRRMGVSAVFILGSPYRTVLDVADPDVTAPIRMYYGTQDPNYQASRAALLDQWQRLGIDAEVVVGDGFGHSSWPPGTIEDGFAWLASQVYATAGGCQPSDTTLCLRDGAFAVEATWTDFEGASGPAGVASARTPESGLLTFFSADNWEIQVKVLDGCPINGHVWVFAAGTTNVGFELVVTEIATGEKSVYGNPVGTASAPILDVVAFPCQN